jgi:hypothetical protein
MDTKKTLLILLVFLGIQETKAQSQVGLSLGGSNNDTNMETLWYQHQLRDNFSLGLQLRYSQIKYRFVDAIAITEGSTAFAGIVLGFKLKESENYRLNFNLTTSYRYISNDDKSELAESTYGLELDPNIILDLRLSEKITLHTGAMLRSAIQLGETQILNEQLPSAIVLAGLSYTVNNHTFAVRAYTGPMNGATGDTMKYFNQLSIGYQFNLSKETHPFSFFNF